MKRARRFSQRSVRWTSLSLCFALVLTALGNIPVQSSSSKQRVLVASGRGQSQNGKSKKAEVGPPKSGPPEARLPNLNEVRQRRDIGARAPEPLESNARSRHKPLESRRGRRVTDSTAPVHPRPIKRGGNVSQKRVFGMTQSSRSVRSHHARMTAPLPQGPSGLVGYWKFDENGGATAADSSGSGVTGTLVNGPSWSTGKVGSALNFDGVDDMVSSAGLASVTNNFTFSFWAYPTATHEIDYESTSGYGGTFGQRFALWPQWNSNGHCGVGISVGTNGVSIYEHASDYMPATLVYQNAISGWTQITVVYENRQPKLYLNGSLVRTGLTGPMSYVHLDPAYIGGQVYGYYAGKLDEVRAYDRALNATEVASLYNSSSGPTPFSGTPIAIPGRLQIENYDNGGAEVAYHDTTAGSFGQDYDNPPNYPLPSFRQPSDVDIFKSASYDNGYLVMGQAGDWTNYTVNVAATGSYTLQAQVAWGGTGGSPGTFHVEMDGIDKTGAIQIPDTNWGFTVITKTGVQLSAGQHLMRVIWDTNAPNGVSGDIDYLHFTAAGGGSAYGGTPVSIPGTLEIENYDNGGADVAYHDTSAGSYGQDYDNSPNYPTPSFRQPTDVDLFKSEGYSNGYLIMMQVGDWMKYSVNVSQTGTYRVQAKTYYWGSPGGTFHIEADGLNVTGAMQLPGGNVWQYVNSTGIQLTAGQHVLRVVCDTNSSDGTYMGDIDYLRITGTSDQFVQTAHQSALLRQPNTSESPYWMDLIRSANAQGSSSAFMAMRELGMTIFESAQYAGRTRSNHEYVQDLYRTYLMREGDPSGVTFWEGCVASMGREGVRHAFDDCEEFHSIVSTLSTSGSASSAVSSLANASVDPFNQPGNQLRARDCEWSLPILGLPGRAGLDLGLSLSYSSMVWTHSGPYMYFDQDIGSPSPGFRLGFPTIQGPLFDAKVGRTVYVVITSSGRIELRQLGTSSIYESFDSSYLKLTVGNGLSLRTTDGTQMFYSAFEDEWHCTGIEDRNGNVISVNYNLGDITNITDTLGRVFTFNYDTYGNVSSISQNWSGQSQPHNWATFGWNDPTVTMHPSFATASVIGTRDGEVLPMLSWVGLADNSKHTFEYDGNGQVKTIRSYAASGDTNPAATLSYVYNGATDDCPRITSQRVSAVNWTGINDVPGSVETLYGLEGDKHTMSVVGDPNVTVYKETYGAGWQRGLTTISEVWAGGTQQKVTTTSWKQDNSDPNAVDAINPRIEWANIVDSAGNHKLTTIGYDTFTLPTGTSCSLPNNVYEYDAYGTTVMRRTYTEYNKDPNYLDRRISGCR